MGKSQDEKDMKCGRATSSSQDQQKPGSSYAKVGVENYTECRILLKLSSEQEN